MANTYKTELEARLHFVAKFMRYSGILEGSNEHKELVADYNKITPLPRGYKATTKDAWCAISLCGQAWELGYRKMPFECSCSRIANAAKKAGLWRSAGLTPEVGDWCLYDWAGDGGPDHIGVVGWVEDDEIWVSEGNYSDSHKIRRIDVSDKRIYGYVTPDYTELVEAPEIKKESEAAMHYKTVNDVPAYALPTIAMLVERGLLLGIDTDDLGLNDELVRTLVILDRSGAFCRTN